MTRQSQPPEQSVYGAQRQLPQGGQQPSGQQFQQDPPLQQPRQEPMQQPMQQPQGTPSGRFQQPRQTEHVQRPYRSQEPPPASPAPPTRPPEPAGTDVAGTGGPPTSAGSGPQPGPAAPPTSMGEPQSAPVGGTMPSEPVPQPLVDIVEAPDEVIVIADVPGFEEEDITIQADENSLSLVAQRSDDLDGDYRIIQSERPTRLERVVQLPPNGDIDGASATHDNGVCTVTIPKGGTDRREIGFH